MIKKEKYEQNGDFFFFFIKGSYEILKFRRFLEIILRNININMQISELMMSLTHNSQLILYRKLKKKEEVIFKLLECNTLTFKAFNKCKIIITQIYCDMRDRFSYGRTKIQNVVNVYSKYMCCEARTSTTD